jgi:recombination associated protein RdgC
MWFKQVQLFQMKDSVNFQPKELEENLALLAFQPCLPSHPSSAGWVSPIEEEGAPLVQAINGYLMICMQFEDKVLPASVIKQELVERIKQRETREERKVRQKEKLALKDEVILSLLPRAFGKISRVYAYIDTKNKCLVLNTTNAKKTEQFISMFQKSVTEQINSYEIKKPSPIMTHWLKNQSSPTAFAIEKSCVLQDPNQQNRIIRCQQQNLFANPIQALVKDGCEVKQLALSWHDQVKFVLAAEDFSLRSIQYEDEITSQTKDMEAETKQQVFNADFFIMTQVLAELLNELLDCFSVKETDSRVHTEVTV